MNQSLLQHTNMTNIFLNDMTVSKVIRKWIESPHGYTGVNWRDQLTGSLGGVTWR